MARNVRVGKDFSPHFLGGPCFSVPELENWWNLIWKFNLSQMFQTDEEEPALIYIWLPFTLTGKEERYNLNYPTKDYDELSKP